MGRIVTDSDHATTTERWSRNEITAEVHALVGAFRAHRLSKRACVFALYENEEVPEQLVECHFGRGGAANHRDVANDSPISSSRSEQASLRSYLFPDVA